MGGDPQVIQIGILRMVLRYEDNIWIGKQLKYSEREAG
jgi:hypothetical protein